MLLQERIELYTGLADTAPVVEVAAAELLGEPISPELMLVSPPQVTQLVRQWLPEPEPLDEWVHRLRREELERREQDVLLEPHAARAERSGTFAAAAFAAAGVIASVLPMLAFVFHL